MKLKKILIAGSLVMCTVTSFYSVLFYVHVRAAHFGVDLSLILGVGIFLSILLLLMLLSTEKRMSSKKTTLILLVGTAIIFSVVEGYFGIQERQIRAEYDSTGNYSGSDIFQPRWPPFENYGIACGGGKCTAND